MTLLLQTVLSANKYPELICVPPICVRNGAEKTTPT